MKTKRFFMVMMIALIGGQVIAVAQDNQQRPQRMSKEQMQEMQLKRMVKDLKLDDATAAKFTPIYKEYQKELEAIQPARPERPEGQAPDPKDENKDNAKKDVKKERPTLTDAQMDEMMAKRFSNARKQADIQEKYYKKFRAILPADKAGRAIEPMQQRGPQMGRPNMRPERPQGKR